MARLDVGLCSNDVSGLVSHRHLLSSYYVSGFTSQKHCEVTRTIPGQARGSSSVKGGQFSEVTEPGNIFPSRPVCQSRERSRGNTPLARQSRWH